MCTPSATLTIWAAAWLAGDHAPDDVLDALLAWAPRQYVVAGDPVTADRIGIGEPPSPSAGLTVLLKTLRTAMAAPSAEIRLLLPIPGDVRGLPAGTTFAAEVAAAGEGVLLGTPGMEGVGLAPQWTEDEALGWTVHSVPVPTTNGVEFTLGEVEYSMSEAVREAAEAMARLRGGATGVGAAEDPRAQVEAELAAYARHRYPKSAPLRARRVLNTADHVAAILTVAQREPSRTPVSASGVREQEDLLRPLWTIIRHARLVAVRAAIRGE